MAELSVIIPVYNMAGGHKVEHCLDSMLHQTFRDIEIIAVDDKSTDESLEILRRYEKEYPGRVRAIASPENRRQGGARNLGLQCATGRYIGFMDADDWVTPDMYETMIRKAEETGADVVGCDMCRVYEYTMVPAEREACNFMNQTGVMDDEKRRAYLLNPGPISTKIYRREVLYDPPFRFPEKIAYEDNATTMELGMRIKHFEHLPEVKVFYYQHGDSTTHSVTRQGCENRMQAMRIMMEYAERNGCLEQYPDVVEYKFTNLFYQNTLFSYMQSGDHADLGFIRSMGKEMRDTFPGFQKNPYYLEKTDPEERMFMKLQQRSTLLFVLYYKLKWFYRGRRYGKK